MLELKNISKKYVTDSFTQTALDDVSVSFRDNEFVAILGPSGSGKTTLLNIIGGLDHFDSGDLVIDGVSTKEYKDRDWDAYRNNRIGFVFQSYNLIPHQTILENVELALTLSGVSRAERKERAREALERVGLGDHINKKPSQLSGGQMQRVAIARALINDPEILLADEPTGALDSVTSVQVMDLLKDVAKDRLVIMVTHNPDLAEQYATRIVRLTDGHIVDDSDPLDPSAVPMREAKPARKTSMSFLTALGLSFNNLMTKKGRTFMTAFAGAIGIIGIAAILALANGVNDYIAGIEEETLSSYPLTITSSASSLTTMLTGDTADAVSEDDDGEDSEDVGSLDAVGTAEAAESDADGDSADDADGSQDSSGDDSDLFSISDLTGEDDEVELTDEITQLNILSSMFATVGTNDLESLRDYFEGDGSEIYDYVSAIQYDYGITPLVYSADTSDGLVQLNPNSFTSMLQTTISSSSIVGTMQSSYSSPFNEMIDNQELLDSEYELLAGEWADEADECMLVLNSSGSITDYTLYSIVVLDPDELDEMVDALTESSTGTEGIEIDDAEDVSFTYEDALGTSFKVLSSADVYRENTETGTWTDMSEDDDYMISQVEDGLDLHIVGVVMPSSSDSSALTEGIAYTHELTEELMARAADSKIVQQQIADPDVDVFTGDTFEELQEEASEGMDLSDSFSVDEDALTAAFSFDEDAISIDMSGFDMSGLDMSDVSIDLSDVGTDVDYSSLFADAPSMDFSDVLDSSSVELTTDETLAVTEVASSLMSGYLSYVSENSSSLTGTTEDEISDQMTALLVAYLQTEDAQALLSTVTAIAGEAASEAMETAITDYVTNDLSAYMESAMSELMEELSAQISDAVATQLSTALASAMTETMEDMSSTLTTELASSLENAVSVDTDAFADALSFTMDSEDFVSLMTSYSDADSLTYDNNLATLGYAVEEEPSTIYIYPIDFEAKESVLDIIDGYNDDMEAAGEDDKVIAYTDYVGALMSNVTDIVDTVSVVLIAFVSISLVVSSIMIGVITYISVLERKKEIGILRALGASKGNVANIFNAETFIEGLISGVLAIVVVYIASVPVNAIILQTYGVANIMQLSPLNAVVLILISVCLTLLAGLIPATSASNRDPVEALRSE